MRDRIRRKLDSAAAVAPDAFGADNHEYQLNPPLPESDVIAFETAHGVRLPEAYRRFLLDLGDGGTGPGYQVRRLARSCTFNAGSCTPGHLAAPSPYQPGGWYRDENWVGSPDHRDATPHDNARGTLTVADHGCTLTTQLIVTGPGRGRLFNVDVDGIGPYVLEDADFLAWYERWLDETIAGYRLGWFGEKLPGDEPVLTAILAGDPSPRRRARAAESLPQLATVTDSMVAALGQAVTDPEPVVRTAVMEVIAQQAIEFAALEPAVRAALRDPAASVREAAIRALYRLRVPDLGACAHALAADPEPAVRHEALRALAYGGFLTILDLAPDLTGDDPRARRHAVGLLREVRPDALEDEPAGPGESAANRHELVRILHRLLTDDESRVREQAAHAARRHGLAGALGLPVGGPWDRTVSGPWHRERQACSGEQHPARGRSGDQDPARVPPARPGDQPGWAEEPPF